MTYQHPMMPDRTDSKVIDLLSRRARPEPQPDELPVQPVRRRDMVRRDIERHIEASRAYRLGVAWLVAAEEQKLPQANIEAALADVRRLYEEMVEAARLLLIVTPTDLKGLVDLLLYLERNYTALPAEITIGGTHGGTPAAESLAFHLLRTVRLSLRAIAKYGKAGYAGD